MANYKGEMYNMPFNMNTFSKMWNIQTPAQAKAKIAEQIADLGITEPKNLEEQALSLVGTDVYEKLIKGYTEKQWGRSCRELPSFIIRRLPLRFTYDNNYFNSRYQGIPVEGYTAIVEKMLSGADIRLNTDYFAHKEELSALAHKTVFTGMLDEYFGFCYGSLEYRSVRFEEERLECDNYQGNAVVNYTTVKFLIHASSNTNTLHSAHSHSPSSPENILRNGNRASNRIIRSMMPKTPLWQPNIRNWLQRKSV